MEEAQLQGRGMNAEYGSVEAPVRSQRSLGRKERTCLSYIAGPDWPVLLLAWIFFALLIISFGLCNSTALGVFTFLYIFAVCSLLIAFSLRGGRPWLVLSAFYAVSCVLGLVLGTVFRTGRALYEAHGGRTLASCVWAMAIYLIFILLISRCLPALGLRIIGSSADRSRLDGLARRDSGIWNDAGAAKMQFGCVLLSEDDQKRFSSEADRLGMDLLHGRCYWSGEPAYDYVFHLANVHSYLGCGLSHPANPFHKWERVLMLATASMLMVFPYAASLVGMGKNFGRFLVQWILVTVPRNLLKMWLKRIVVADDELTLRQNSPGRRKGSGEKQAKSAMAVRWQSAAEVVKQSIKNDTTDSDWQVASMTLRAVNAFWWEVLLFSCSVILAVIVCVMSCMYIQAHSPKPLGWVLLDGCNSLVWAFVVELIFDLLASYQPLDNSLNHEAAWYVGFFHRWQQEREEHIRRTGR